MNGNAMSVFGTHLLHEARVLHAAFPDVAALRELSVGELPPWGGESEAAAACRRALGYLRDEMLLVRAGAVRDLTVLGDEIACAERALARLECVPEAA